MPEQNPYLQSLDDIKELMHKSSRFVSLSGWSGVAAGVCALIGASIAKTRIDQHVLETRSIFGHYSGRDAITGGRYPLTGQLLVIGALTFIAAFVLAFIFTYIRSRKKGVAIWGLTARRVMINVSIPMIVGGIFILRMTTLGFYGLIAPACLLFYGLGLINAAKYTLREIRYLGFCQLLLGLINLWMIGYGLYFWAIGFGLLHIIYGIVMWNRYERHQ